MVIKNFTGHYKTKFPATVSNDSCLKCHMDGTLKDRQKLESWVVTKNMKNIKFNHKVMIHQKVFDIELKCTSCHMHYRYPETTSHLYVPPGVCYHCHLLDRKEDTGTTVGNCYTCHFQEDIENTIGTTVTIGNGDVPIERCFSCHWDAKKFDDAKYQHDVHVSNYQDFTKPGIACIECHEPIRHGDLTKVLGESPF